MRRAFILLIMCGVLVGGAVQAQAAATQLAVLSFAENGQIAKGAGKTLAMLLSSSLDARRYHLIDPQRLHVVLKRHQWDTKRDLSPALLLELSKLGIKLILTGGISRHYKVFTATYRAVSLKGRILHSEVLPPVKSWSGLVSSLQYSVRVLLRRSQPRRINLKGKKGKKGKKGAKGKKGKKKKSKRKDFDTVVKGMKQVAGIFPLWIKKNDFGERVIYMEIAPNQFDKMYLASPTLEGGTGTYPLLTFAQLPEFPIKFVKRGKYVLVIEPNVRFRADQKAAISRVLNRSFTESLRAAVTIISKPHPKRKTILVNFKTLFMKQLAKLDFWLRVGFRIYKRSVPMDANLSRFGKIQNFPKNLEIEFQAFFRRYGSSAVIPEGTHMRVNLRYSISERPDSKYRPRLADDRVGHFLQIAKDYTNDKVDTRYVRYITRWHLEKKYPKQAISEPKKPIVFWLENAIPRRYRHAVKRGIEVWNQAFLQAGFKNAIKAKQQPDDAKWDGADVRYNTIRWFLANNAGFAQGPSRTDPITGQIYDADVRVSADMGTFLYRQFQLQVSPLQWMKGTGLDTLLQPSIHTNSLVRLERLLKQIDAPQQKITHKHGHPHKDWRFCNYGRGAMTQAALGWHLMQMRGDLPNPEMEKQFIDEFMVSLIAHEVGHTLGLRHNFKASTLHTYEQLHDKKRTIKMGLTNSMMEYTPVNLAAPGKTQGQFWQTTLGPYDKWAIEYAYKTFPGTTSPEDERPFLNKIAKRVANPDLAYATDEDAFGGASPFSVDPTTLRWDLGKEPLDYYDARLNIARELWSKIETKFGTSKSSYQRMLTVFNMGLGTYFRSGMQAAKYIGGLYHRRDHIGDPNGRVPFKPVPAAKQRRALDFLVKNYFSKGNFQWSHKLLNKLAPTRMWDFSFSVWGMRVDYPIHRMALVMHLMPMLRILHPAVLDRVQDIQRRQPKSAAYLSINELFGKVTDAIWEELNAKVAPAAKAASKSGKTTTAPTVTGPTVTAPKAAAQPTVAIDSIRRNVQWFHLQWMIAYQQATDMTISDATTVAGLQLTTLRDRIKRALPLTKDPVSKAHLNKALQRINVALNPRLIQLR